MQAENSYLVYFEYAEFDSDIHFLAFDRKYLFRVNLIQNNKI